MITGKMNNKYDPVDEIDAAEQDFHEYKNPRYDKERGFKLNETMFEVEVALKEILNENNENLEDNSPIDED
jgi:hypothetical protein